MKKTLEQHMEKVDYYAEEEDSVSDSMIRKSIHLSMKLPVMEKRSVH